MSEAGLTRLADNLAVALKEHGVQVFVMSPGFVQTEMTEEVPEDFKAQVPGRPLRIPGSCV